MKRNLLVFLSVFFVFTVLILGIIAKEVEWQEGPKTIGLDKNAVAVFVPEGFVFADKENGNEYLRKNGVKRNGNEVGLIMSGDISQEWFVLLQYQKVGYFKEEWFTNMDADQFIKGMEKKTKSARIINPIGPKLEINGYKEKPFYDTRTNTLSSAIKVKQGKLDLVNYIVMKYGRQAVLVVRLVCEEEMFSDLKPQMDKIVENINFQSGYKYADFDPDKDKYALSSGSDVLKYMLTGDIPSIDEDEDKKKKKSAKKKKDKKQSDIGFGDVPMSILFFGGIIGIIVVFYIIKSIMS